MRWATHVARMGGEVVNTGFWWQNLKERDHLEDLGVDERIILSGSSRNNDWRVRDGFVAQDKDTWPVLMSTVMNFRVPYML